MNTPAAPQRATKRFSLDLTPAQHRALRIASVEEDTPAADIIRALLDGYLHDRAAKAPTPAPVTLPEAPAPVPAPVRSPYGDPRAERLLAEADARDSRRRGLPITPPARTA